MLKEGEMAPDFSLVDDQGSEIKLSGFLGRKVVVYFYPRDNTSGCTKEACSFRDVYDQILETGTAVLGISPDATATHQKFKQKHGLPFHLLSDSDHQVAKLFGAWGEKKMYGKVSQGIIRSTFIIDESGKIIKVFPKVSPEGHGQQVLAYLGG